MYQLNQQSCPPNLISVPLLLMSKLVYWSVTCPFYCRIFLHLVYWLHHFLSMLVQLFTKWHHYFRSVRILDIGPIMLLVIVYIIGNNMRDNDLVLQHVYFSEYSSIPIMLSISRTYVASWSFFVFKWCPRLAWTPHCINCNHCV